MDGVVRCCTAFEASHVSPLSITHTDFDIRKNKCRMYDVKETVCNFSALILWSDNN